MDDAPTIRFYSHQSFGRCLKALQGEVLEVNGRRGSLFFVSHGVMKMLWHSDGPFDMGEMLAAEVETIDVLT